MIWRKDHADDVARESAEEAAASSSPERPHVFLEVGIGDQQIGRIGIELFSDIVPRAAENFRLLCTGQKGLGCAGKPLHYRGSAFHRVIPNFVIQGGDITKGDGTGSESAYGSAFEDEGFLLSHSARGLLSLANQGPNSNGSQFAILLGPSPQLDKKHTVFGKVVSGRTVLDRVEATCGVAGACDKVGINREGTGLLAFRTAKTAWITDCGEMPRQDARAIKDACGDAESEHAAKRRRLDGAVHLFHIIKTHKDSRLPVTWQREAATCTKAKAKLAIANIRKRLVASSAIESTFVDLAREHSEESSAQFGGDMGPVEHGTLIPEVEDVGFALQAGELSEPFESARGIHLLLRAM